MVFSVTILGSNAAVPTLQRNPSAHLLNANERLFLLDCAEGTQLQLRKFHIHFQRIDHILISHLHGDHFFGLIGLLTTYHLLGRQNPLHLYAPPQLEEIIFLQLNASLTRLNYPVEFHFLTATDRQLIFEDERIEAFAFPLKHSIPTFGFLVREKIQVRRQRCKRSYAYCTDTVYDRDLIPTIREVSLLYHETTFRKNMAGIAAEKMHSTTTEAATIARDAQVGRLLIGHFSARYTDLEPLLEEARAIFPETILARDGETIPV